MNPCQNSPLHTLRGLFHFLLLVGLPTFMHERKEQGLLNAVCVWGVGLLVLVTLLVSMILLWFNVLTPEYLRATVG